MKRLSIIFLFISHLAIFAGSLKPESVVLLYNSGLQASKDLALFYAEKRSIPRRNIIGLELPLLDQISHDQYNTLLRDPLYEIFRERGWWISNKAKENQVLPKKCKISALVCFYGVPYKIQREAILNSASEGSKNAIKPASTIMHPRMASVTESALDSELCLLPFPEYEIRGAIKNPYFQKAELYLDVFLSRVLMVGRIDAPSIETCKRMIVDAIEVEKNGLWGICYLDFARKTGGYQMADSWIEKVARQNEKKAIPTIVDLNKQTYPRNYPMEDAALYYGWYTTHCNGPFLNDRFRFRQGAVAMHLHSFSAHKLRSKNIHWTGPLLSKGAAATVGNVYEPYLHLTHHIDILHDRLLKGHSLIEAAYMATPALSWQNVVLGDPLYRPFLHHNGSGKILEKDKYFRAVQLAHEKWGLKPKELVKNLRALAESSSDGFVLEYLALWHYYRHKEYESISYFKKAEKNYKRDADRLRQLLHIAELYRHKAKKELAIKTLEEAMKKYAHIPESSAPESILGILDPPPPTETLLDSNL